jgi:hypothetical protein
MKFISFVLFFFILFSCTEKKKIKENSDKENSEIPTTVSHEFENHLKNQLHEYLTAFIEKDVQKILKYFYSGIFDYSRIHSIFL